MMSFITSAFSCLRYLDAANSITTLNIIISVITAHFALSGEIYLAAVTLCATAVIDFLDGYIARTWLYNRHENRLFGKQLDSLADLLNFSVAPALVLMHLTPGTFAFFAGMALIASGCLRLSVFSVISAAEPGSYRGLPTTYAGLVFSLFLPFVAAGKVDADTMPGVTLCIAVLQIINVRLPKYPALPTVAAFILLFITSSYFAR